MTTEEFKVIKWRLVGHLSMASTHYSTYEGECSELIKHFQ